MSRANWFDRATAFFAPGVAAARLAARERFEQLAASRSYAGAALGRHTDGWRVHSTSADAEIHAGGRRLRDRSRDLERNNPHAAKAVSNWVTDLVGDGILPRPDSGRKARDKKVKAAFDKWSRRCDADGQLDFFGLQTLAVRGMVTGGEMLARRRWRRPQDGHDIPVQIQLLEPDFLDDARHGLFPGGNSAIQGIEFDQIGRRTAYWLFSEHPGNNFATVLSGITSKRIPATEIVHLYEKQRTQARGVPWCAPVIRRMRDVDDYDFAEGIRKKIEASVVGIVTSEDESDPSIAPIVKDAHGNIIEKMAPGLIGYARNGKEIKFNQPATIGGYEEYKRVSAREIAAGFRQPYELLTGDLSTVNFSSARIGLVAYRRLVSQMQWQIIIPMLLEPWWNWFCEAAYLAGEIDTPDVPVEWSPPKWAAIDPYKDALADLITIRTGTRSWQDVTAERGRNPADVLADIVRFNADVDRDGVVLDSDPRRMTKAGAIQIVTGADQASAADDPTAN